MNFKKPIIVAIAAVSGGGKTYITSKLQENIENSEVLCFDDYDSDGPKSISEWVENGCDYNEWHLNLLMEAIDSIISNKKRQTDLILLDYPFARKHDEMSKYIDHTIFIDTPLDIALSRRILRDFKNRSKSDIEKNLSDYVTFSRLGYLEMLKSIKPNSDYIVDGSLEGSIIIEKIMKEIAMVSEKL